MNTAIARRTKISKPARRPAAPAKAPGNAWPVEELDVEAIERNPHNPREVTADDVEGLAESIRREGLLEPILVRRLMGGYQLISGERRWVAHKVAGLATIRAQVIGEGEIDDGDVLRKLATENAQREDFNPLDRARLIAKLCAPLVEGGGGLGREDAGLIFGLSASAASNLVRLLDLPADALDLVRTGELAESFARLLVPYRKAPAVIAAVLEQWRKELKWYGNVTREQFERLAGDAAQRNTRPMDPSFKGQWSNELSRHVGVMFKPTPEQLEALAVVEFPGKASQGGGPRATNCQLWDELQREAIAAAAARAEARRAKAAGKGKAGGKAGEAVDPKRAAEIEARAEAERGEKLARRVVEWRLAWLRRELAAAVRPGDWQTAKFALWALGSMRDWKTANEVDAAIRKAIREAGGRPAIGYGSDADKWRAVDSLPMARWGEADGDAARRSLDLEDVWQIVAQELLDPDDDNGRRPAPIDPAVVEGLAVDYGLDVPALWRKLWATHHGRDAAEAFLDLHTTAQLGELAGEWGAAAAVEGLAKKGELVAALRGLDPAPKLPAAIVAAGPKPKRKKGARE